MAAHFQTPTSHFRTCGSAPMQQFEQGQSRSLGRLVEPERDPHAQLVVGSLRHVSLISSFADSSNIGRGPLLDVLMKPCRSMKSLAISTQAAFYRMSKTWPQRRRLGKAPGAEALQSSECYLTTTRSTPVA
jgi:hypothetical protein